ncbi:MAG: hypothetical protein GX754_08905 [Clostridiaceae bacterium]|nr:hypothetical protein [Clostridiaceae bacterium]
MLTLNKAGRLQGNKQDVFGKIFYSIILVVLRVILLCIIGIDVGTSGCKATIIDFEGNVKGQSYREYSLISSNYGWLEIDPIQVWNSVKEVIAESISYYNGEDIKAISVSSFGEAVVPVDRKGNVLNNSIMYIDSRGSEEAAFLREKLGNDKILGITGTTVHQMYSINKIMWLKQHRPETYNNTWKLCSLQILYYLSLVPIPIPTILWQPERWPLTS